MIQVFHWFASFVVLSVCMAQLESIKITATGGIMLLVRAAGWAFIGIDSFASIIGPFFPRFEIGCQFGMIGLAVLAVSYHWQGATRHVRDR